MSDIRIPKSILVSLKSNENVPGGVVDAKGSVGLTGWINQEIAAGNINAGSGGGSSDAEDITVTPAGNLTSTDVQAALVELQTDIDAGGSTIYNANGQLSGARTVDANGENLSISNVNTFTASGPDGSIVIDHTNTRLRFAYASRTVDLTSTAGLQYDSEFHSNYTNRSLVDKEYVDSLTTLTYATILTDGTTTVSVVYAGTVPTAAVAGGNNETVTVTLPAGCILYKAIVRGNDDEVDGNNDRTIVFDGAGLNGNTGVDDLNIPTVQKTAVLNTFGAPSTGNAYPIDLDNNPAVQVVGVGSPGTPSLTMRFVGLNSFDAHNLTFTNF
jgi:hypothetical protein